VLGLPTRKASASPDASPNVCLARYKLWNTIKQKEKAHKPKRSFSPLQTGTIRLTKNKKARQPRFCGCKKEKKKNDTIDTPL
jgi:hypothetical protein